MLLIRNLYTVIIIFLTIVNANAQISPGKLYKGHSKLEGLSNCIKCHDIGKKVSNQKCLDCHKEIKSLIESKRSYHYSKEVRNKDCAVCHSDHHGEKFQIIRFDVDNFDHDLADYELIGAHNKIDCAKCHTSDYINDKELKKDLDTYLGLETNCLSCHDDYHRDELDKDCLKCHDFKDFKSAPGFDHNDSKFPLLGKHENIDCEKCHKITEEVEESYQTFKNLEFQKCNDCHDDVHSGSLNISCNNCHNENSFKISVVSKKFNHNKKTNFLLKGKHKYLDCYSCHSSEKSLKKIFSDYANNSQPDCINCHEDIHNNKFGEDCNDCHTETSFKKLKSLNNFNHTLTGFELVGKHNQVDCKECHKSDDMTEPILHQKCTDCHSDFHSGEIVENGFVKDCNNCHTENGFLDFNFGIEEHNNTVFPLIESHQAVPCVFCHQKNENKNWKFKNIGLDCVECHEDIHKLELDIKYYPEKECNNCHKETMWNDIDLFDHNSTNFILKGKHQKISCGQCHYKDRNTELSPIIFKGISQECANCHADIHFGQFEESGKSNCAKCHTSDNWFPSLFDHNNTRFKLEGVHANLDCIECHYSDGLNNKEKIIYKNNKIECIDCHK